MLTDHIMDSQTQTHGDQDQQNPSGYEPTWPKDLGISPMPAASIFQFITRFFQVSDNPDLTEEWLSFFGEEAKVVMGEKVAEGMDGTQPHTSLPASISLSSCVSWLKM